MLELSLFGINLINQNCSSMEKIFKRSEIILFLTDENRIVNQNYLKVSLKKDGDQFFLKISVKMLYSIDRLEMIKEKLANISKR
jgi:hypothetical protein